MIPLCPHPYGRVYAVDIQPEMLAELEHRAHSHGLKNVYNAGRFKWIRWIEEV